MTPAPIFDRAYTLAKELVITGRWQPGQRVDLAGIAKELGTSLTPVRDALYRLLGERLLTGGPNDGFIVPTCTEPDLTDMLEWSSSLLGMALRTASLPPVPATFQTDVTAPVGERIRAVFHCIAQSSSNGELDAELANVNDRLHAARLAEAAVFDDLEAEWQALRTTLGSIDLAQIRSTLQRYHRRRVRSAGQIVRAMHRSRTA